MILIALGFVVGIVFLFYSFIEVKRNREKVEELIGGKHFDVYDTSKVPCIIMAIFILPCIAVAIYNFNIQNWLYVAMSSMLAMMFAGEVYILKHMHVMYYNNDGFIANGRYLRYKSVRSINKKVPHFLMQAIVLTVNNEKITISNKMCDFLKDNNYIK